MANYFPTPVCFHSAMLTILIKGYYTYMYAAIYGLYYHPYSFYSTDYETSRRQREIEDYCKQQVYTIDSPHRSIVVFSYTPKSSQVLDELAEDICQELIDSWLSEFAREVVNSCFGDIVSRYM